MDDNRVQKRRILQELLKRFEKRPINVDSKSDMQFLISKVNMLFDIINSEYQAGLKDMYENIEFKTVKQDENVLGAYLSNVGADGKGNIKRVRENNELRFNINSFCSDACLGSSSMGDRIYGCIFILDTLEHEFTHYYQDIQRKQNKLSMGSVESAKESIQTMIKYKEVYDKNYWSMSDEIGARINAYSRTKQVLKTIPDQEKFKIYSYYYNLHRNPDEFDLCLERTAIFGEQEEGSQDKNYFFNQRADEYIMQNPEILNVYKTLQNEYNMDGTKKSVTQLLTDCKAKMNLALSKEGISDEQRNKLRLMVRNTYFELIGSRLEEISVDEAKEIEKTLGGFGTGNLYDNMYKYHLDMYNKKQEAYEKIEKMYEGNSQLRKKTNNERRREFEENKRICKEKYERILGNVLRLKGKYYGRLDKSIINGVDLPNIPKVRLDDKNTEARKNFISEFLKTYGAVEDDFDFKRRQLLEYKYFSLIMNAIKTQRCPSGFMATFQKDGKRLFDEKQIKLMMKTIKAADSLTLNGGPNILQEFLNTPFINYTLSQIKCDDTYGRMKQIAERKQNVSIKETEIDKAKRIITEKLNKLTDEQAKETFNKYRRHTSNALLAHENSNDKWKDDIYRISAIQQGFRPGPVEQDGYVHLQNKESAIIDVDDIRALGRSNIVKKVVVNGRPYEAIIDNSRRFSERT